LLNDSLTFAGTMLLNLLVRHLEDAQAAAAAAAAAGSNGGSSACGGSSSGALSALLPPWCGQGTACMGYTLAALLGGSVVAKALISSHYNYGLNLVSLRWGLG
jgi:hypothetical protein